MSKTTIRNIVISFVLILVSVFVFGLMVYQVTQQGTKLVAQIDALSKEQAQQESRLRLQRTAEETTEDRAQLQSYFLSRESDSINFLNQVEEMAPTIGVSLKTSGLESVVDSANNTKWIQAGFTFSGSRERVQRFIQILETFPLVSRIMAVDMIARTDTEWQASIIMQVQVLEYDK